jgi:hypothetical protein
MWIGVMSAMISCADIKDVTSELTGDCMVDPVVIEVGQGELEFSMLSDGDEVMIVHGPQGGWHITGSIRVTGIGQIGRVNFRIQDMESGVYVTDYWYNVAMVMEDDCTGTFVNMTGFVNVAELEGEGSIPPDFLAGGSLKITMGADDFDDRSGSSSVVVVGLRDPQDM